MWELLPEMEKGQGMRQHLQYHRYDVMEHGLRACAAAEPTRLLRMAALLHDVGKPYAVEQSGIPAEAALDWRTYGAPRSPMQGHDEIGAQVAQKILERLRWPKAEGERILLLIRYHMYDLKGEAKDGTLRARFAELGWETSHQLCAIREADIRGSGMEPDYTVWRWREIPCHWKNTENRNSTHTAARAARLRAAYHARSTKSGIRMLCSSSNRAPTWRKHTK